MHPLVTQINQKDELRLKMMTIPTCRREGDHQQRKNHIVISSMA